MIHFTSAGMNVVAVATPFNHSSQLLEHARVVHDPSELLDAVKERMAEHDRMAHWDQAGATRTLRRLGRYADKGFE